MRPRTLSIGGATYDLFVRTEADSLKVDNDERVIALPVGGKIRVHDVIETCGGGACNTSVGLQRLGCIASFAGVLGSDPWGERLLKNFEREGVDTKSATVVEGETSSFSIILSLQGGERTILYAPGTNVHMHDAMFDKERAAMNDWIYLNHLHERGCVIEDDLIALLQGKHGPRLTWNPGGPQLKRGMQEANVQSLLACTTLFVCNKEEALAFTGTESVEEALRALRAAGVVIACVTDGANGVTAMDATSQVRCATVQDAPIVDTTGAGDAFGTGATWALLQGLDLPTALRAGTINATSVLGTIGAQAGLLTNTEMQQRLSATALKAHVMPLQ